MPARTGVLCARDSRANRLDLASGRQPGESRDCARRGRSHANRAISRSIGARLLASSNPRQPKLTAGQSPDFVTRQGGLNQCQMAQAITRVTEDNLFGLLFPAQLLALRRRLESGSLLLKSLRRKRT